MTNDLQTRLARAGETLDHAVTQELRRREVGASSATVRGGQRRAVPLLVAVCALAAGVLFLSRPTPATRVATGPSAGLPFFQPTFVPAGMSVQFQGESFTPAPSDSTTAFFRRPGESMSSATLEMRSERGDGADVPVEIGPLGTLTGSVALDGWVLQLTGRGVSAQQLQQLLDSIDTIDDHGVPDIPGFAIVSASVPSVATHVVSYGEAGRGANGAGFQSIQISVASTPLEAEGRAMLDGTAITETSIGSLPATRVTKASPDPGVTWTQLSWLDAQDAFSVLVTGFEPEIATRIAESIIETDAAEWQALTPERHQAPTVIPNGPHWTPDARSIVRRESAAHTDSSLTRTAVYRPVEQAGLLPNSMVLRFEQPVGGQDVIDTVPGDIVAGSSDIQVVLHPTLAGDSPLDLWAITITTPSHRATGELVGMRSSAQATADAVAASEASGSGVIENWSVVADSDTTDPLVAASSVRWADQSADMDIDTTTDLLTSPFRSLISAATTPESIEHIDILGRPGLLLMLDNGSAYAVAESDRSVVTVTMTATAAASARSLLTQLHVGPWPGFA